MNSPADYGLPRRSGAGVKGVGVGATRGREATGLAGMLSRRWGFLVFVVLPVLLCAIYYFGLAADQFQSEAHFLVRNGQQSAVSSTGIGQLFGIGGLPQDQSDGYAIVDYLGSHDAVAAANQRLDLVALFRRPEADPLARLWWDHPAAETLNAYFHRQVRVTFNPDSGEAVLVARAFRPADAKQLAETLLELGEARANTMNQRAEDDSLKVSNDELAAAEAELASIQAQMTQFRTSGRDIDPEKTSSAQLLLVSRLQEELAQATAQLSAMAPTVDHQSPQYVALEDRIRGLQSQVGAQAGRLAGPSGGMAPQLADYQGLQLREDLAAKRYAAATASLAAAREEALKQQIFVVRVVEPNMPEKSLYPRRLMTVFGVLVGTLLAYGIGWLVLAGVREHAA
jgi:capsular polysaccharide transport system permease protein